MFETQFFQLADDTIVHLEEKWQTKGKHLSAAHRKKISDALKGRGRGPIAKALKVGASGAGTGKSALAKAHPVGSHIRTKDGRLKVTGHASGYIGVEGGKKKWYKLGELQGQQDKKLVKPVVAKKATPATKKLVSSAEGAVKVRPATRWMDLPPEEQAKRKKENPEAYKWLKKTSPDMVFADGHLPSAADISHVKPGSWLEGYKANPSAYKDNTGQAGNWVGPHPGEPSFTRHDHIGWAADKSKATRAKLPPISAEHPVRDPNFHKQWNEWSANLTPKEFESIHSYAGAEASFGINKRLRAGGEPTELDKVRDAVLAAGRAPKAFEVYRGMKWGSPASLVPGALLVDKGYGSTSMISGNALGGNVQMKINIPAGSKGAFVASASGKGEPEWLLPRGYTLKVAEATTKNGITSVVADLVEA